MTKTELEQTIAAYTAEYNKLKYGAWKDKERRKKNQARAEVLKLKISVLRLDLENLIYKEKGNARYPAGQAPAKAATVQTPIRKVKLATW